LPHGITQCYLPPDTSELAPPNPSQTGWYSIYLPRRGGRLACYIPRWFTRPQTVTHPSTNRAQCRLTSFIKPTPLTTTLRRHLLGGSVYLVHVWSDVACGLRRLNSYHSMTAKNHLHHHHLHCLRRVLIPCLAVWKPGSPESVAVCQ